MSRFIAIIISLMYAVGGLLTGYFAYALRLKAQAAEAGMDVDMVMEFVQGNNYYFAIGIGLMVVATLFHFLQIGSARRNDQKHSAYEGELKGSVEANKNEIEDLKASVAENSSLIEFCRDAISQAAAPKPATPDIPLLTEEVAPRDYVDPMKMKVINLFGGPGSGKSTTAAGLFYRMKLLGLNVELVTEYAKQLLFEGRLEGMLDRQEYIYAKQHARIQDLADKADWVVTDSPILLSAVYPEVNAILDTSGTLKPWPALSQFQALVRSQYSFYDNINIWLQRPLEYQSEGRLQKSDEAEMIDDRILIELKGHDLKIVEVDETTVDTILWILKLR